ncbi:glycosyltransferase family 2 protein [Aliiruegeria lutimaris]|uniref:Glycosyl transferase family 2 n=1 Tax=Aliiruegeria lutimaris TaxID=571298 RepID=A0A1G8VZF8_9RHOB|nr:glycosyltransferase [Aliiruegeria lutimaris]SDJ70865.1 Glycosyl transferase family 2 [Aliiruegeria lutimaris]
MPRLSVVVTSYNIEAFIGECLADICGQTLDDIEIIVVDDGSSDGTAGKIAEFASCDDRIVPVLLEENTIGGVATAANAGIEQARGAYIGFADGDDRYEPEMFAKLLAAAEAHDADLAMCSYLNWDAVTGQTAMPPDEERWNELAPLSVLELDATGRHRLLPLNAVPWRKIYRASLLKEQGLRFPVGDFFFEDNPFHWFNTLSANRVAFVDERLCRHRVNRIGQTTATVDSKLLKMFRHHGIIKRWLEENGQDAEFSGDLLSWASRQLSWIGRKCPPELRQELFEAIQAVVALHAEAELDSPQTRAAIGKRTANLLQAARKGDFDAFCRDLDRAAARAPRRRSADASTGIMGRMRRILAR